MPEFGSSKVSTFRRLDWLLPILIFLPLYVLTITGHNPAAHDSVLHVADVSRGTRFHPCHLVFFSLHRLWWQLCSALGVPLPLHLIMACLNICFAMLVLTLFYTILRRRAGFTGSQAMLATLLPGVSYGFWMHTVAISPYIISISMLLLGLFWMTRKPDLRPWDFFIIGAFHAAAIVIHQQHVLYVFVVLAAALFRLSGWRAFFARWACYTTSIVCLVMLPYFLVMRFGYGFKTPTEMLHWMTSFGHEDSYWRGLSLETIARAMVGFGHSLVGGSWLFAQPRLAEILTSRLHGHFFEDQFFLVRNLHPPLVTALCGMTIALAAAMSGSAALALTGFSGLRARTWQLGRLVLVWLGIYSTFFLFWCPELTEFWIPQSVLFWMLAALLWAGINIEARRRLMACGLGAVAALLFAINYLGDLRLSSDPRNDYYLQTVTEVADHTRHGDLILLNDPWQWFDYYTYYAPAKVRTLGGIIAPGRNQQPDARNLEQLVEVTRMSGGQVLFTPDAHDFKPDGLKLDTTQQARLNEVAERWKKEAGRVTFGGRAFTRLGPANGLAMSGGINPALPHRTSDTTHTQLAGY